MLSKREGMLTQNVYEYRNNCKRFEPRHHFKSRLSMSVRVNILLNSTHINDIIIHQTLTHYEKSDWSRAFNQFRIACELDMINAIIICCRYCIYHVKFNVCLVTKPLGVFSSETEWLNALLLFLRMNYFQLMFIKIFR